MLGSRFAMLLVMAGVAKGYLLQITADDNLTGLYYSVPELPNVQLPLPQFAIDPYIADQITVPNNAVVLGFCAARVDNARIAAVLLDDEGKIQDFEIKCTVTDLDYVVNTGYWLSNTFVDDVWQKPFENTFTTDVVANTIWESTNQAPIFHSLDAPEMCCRRVISLPNHPCLDPSLCWPGTCLHNGADYLCDCSGSGFTGNKSCDHRIPRSGCGHLQVVKCLECDWSVSEEECDAFGKLNSCFLSDPVCRIEEQYDSYGSLRFFRRSCTERGLKPTGVAFSTSVGDPVTYYFNVTWVEFGSCHDGPCDDDEQLHCISTKAYGEIAAWMFANYTKCHANEVCFHKFTMGFKSSVQRGCMKISDCPPGSIGPGNYACMDVDEFEHKCCVNCDFAMPPPQPRQPTRSRYTCKTPDVGICACKGDPHCRTFDDFRIFQLPSTCWHVLSQTDCSGGLPTGPNSTFHVDIRIKRIPPHKWSIEEARIFYKDTVVLVGQVNGLVTWNNEASEKLREGQTVVIDPSGDLVRLDYNDVNDTLQVMLANGIRVGWDFKRTVNVMVPDTFKGTMCGICGNYDDNINVGDYSYGYADAGSKCPTQADTLVDKTPGSRAIGRQSQHAFAMSWFSDVDAEGSDCHAYCGLGGV